MIIKDFISWKDCLDVVFQPILARGSADLTYLNRCKDVFYKNYGQMLIGPNIYLPHTTPSETDRFDIEIVLFKQPTIDPNGHPLRLIVGLVPAKTNEHVPLLLMLNDLFLNQESLERLAFSETKSQVLCVFEGGDAIEK
jgi:mannitol/fructose-specific phosphotransferase system IIA component (Ntr-type)